ncbi:hypothetical protein HDU86_004405 [Geranomyces michiganensis]|nr:hypothetical protein HDU86_004405 [Geranomyces michiganensis]
MTTTESTAPAAQGSDDTAALPPANKKYFRKALNYLNANNLGQLKAVHNHTDVGARDADFYTAAIADEVYTRLALFNDICVGGVTAKPTQDGAQVEITSLSVLPAYRHLGLGTMLIDHIAEKGEAAGLREIRVGSVGKDERAFYSARGFIEKDGAFVKTLAGPVSA